MTTTVTPYLSFGGNTREAFAFYEQALGAKTGVMLALELETVEAVNGASLPIN